MQGLLFPSFGKQQQPELAQVAQTLALTMILQRWLRAPSAPQRIFTAAFRAGLFTVWRVLHAPAAARV
jgi:hypothetical protein